MAKIVSADRNDVTLVWICVERQCPTSGKGFVMYTRFAGMKTPLLFRFPDSQVTSTRIRQYRIAEIASGKITTRNTGNSCQEWQNFRAALKLSDLITPLPSPVSVSSISIGDPKETSQVSETLRHFVVFLVPIGLRRAQLNLKFPKFK